MGAELRHLSNHNLDLSSLEALAKDISKRFHVNVKYGFEESAYFQHHRIYPGAERRFDFYDDIPNYAIGYINHPYSRGTAILMEDDFLEKRLFEQFGRKPPIQYFIREEDVKWWNFDFVNEIQAPWFYLTGDEVTVPSATITKGGISLGIGDFVSWNHFISAVFEDYIGDGLQTIIQYRRDIKRFSELCGGTTSYHVMGSRGFDQMDTWEETEKHIISHAGKDFKDIVEVLCSIGPKLNFENYELQEHYARAFSDDFRDLKNPSLFSYPLRETAYKRMELVDIYSNYPKGNYAFVCRLLLNYLREYEKWYDAIGSEAQITEVRVVEQEVYTQFIMSELSKYDRRLNEISYLITNDLIPALASEIGEKKHVQVNAVKQIVRILDHLKNSERALMAQRAKGGFYKHCRHLLLGFSRPAVSELGRFHKLLWEHFETDDETNATFLFAYTPKPWRHREDVLKMIDF